MNRMWEEGFKTMVCLHYDTPSSLLSVLNSPQEDVIIRLLSKLDKDQDMLKTVLDMMSPEEKFSSDYDSLGSKANYAKAYTLRGRPYFFNLFLQATEKCGLWETYFGFLANVVITAALVILDKFDGVTTEQRDDITRLLVGPITHKTPPDVVLNPEMGSFERIALEIVSIFDRPPLPVFFPPCGDLREMKALLDEMSRKVTVNAYHEIVG